MIKLTLPKNSRVSKSKTWPKPQGATNLRQFHIYRYSPKENGNPRWDLYWVNIDRARTIILDILLYIKNSVNPTLTFRQSCHKGVCGSCSMNITGTNTIACTKGFNKLPGGIISISPLPHLPIIKNLIPDLTNFYTQHAYVQPFLKTITPNPEKE